MKKLRNLKQYTLIILSAFAIASCEKEDTEITNGSNNLSSEEKIIEVESKLVFHKNYDGNLSEEEAAAQFDEDLKKYMSENKYKSESGGFNYVIETKTGNNGTDGEVQSMTGMILGNNNGSRVSIGVKKELNISNKNDRQPNSWDFYHLHVDTGNSRPSWVELIGSEISLQGTDGWHLKTLFVKVRAFENPNTSGLSIISDNPNVHLDNDNNNTLDGYYTGDVGIGRINFN